MNSPRPKPLEGFLRIEQVLDLYPISRSAWLRGVNEGRFPAPVQLTPRTIAWRVADIRSLIQSAKEVA
jgi:predicted DNA-binding transcriptional regulator AlpA